MRVTSILSRSAGVVSLIVFAGLAQAGPPQYSIVNLGTIDPGDGVQGFRVSNNGIATGRTLGVSNQAYSWTEGGGFVPLPNEATRPFGVGNGVNDFGTVVGTGATTFFGSGALPLIWTGGMVSALPLPAGQTLGRANDINNSGVAVGSVNGGSLEAAVIYSGGSASIITTAAMDGSTIRTAFSINNGGLVVGFGVDPNNAARNVGSVYDSVADTLTEVGFLPGRNGALAFDVSDAGHVVGATMQNQGSGVPFIWTASGGMVEVPLPAGATQGGARGVNSNGWVVGTASTAFALPYVFDGTTTHLLQDLIPVGSGWDLSMNTSSSAFGISEDGVIVGTGVFNGDVRAYAMIPAAAACVTDFNVDGVTDAGDLAALLAAWGMPGVTDFNVDGTTDAGDLAVLLAAWGPCP